MADLVLHSLAGKNPDICYNGALLERDGDYSIIRDNATGGHHVVFHFGVKVGSTITVFNQYNSFLGVYRADNTHWIQVSANIGCEDPRQQPALPKVGLEEPKNNDGRDKCYWCGGMVKRVQGFSSAYDVCEVCGK
jgi:hypothetical protein